MVHTYVNTVSSTYIHRYKPSLWVVSVWTFRQDLRNTLWERSGILRSLVLNWLVDTTGQTPNRGRFCFFLWISHGKFADKIFNFDGIANFFFLRVEIIKEKINTEMIKSNNWALLFGALEFVQTIISQFVLISWQNYIWSGNPYNWKKSPSVLGSDILVTDSIGMLHSYISNR